MIATKYIATLALLTGASGLFAQQIPMNSPQNVVQLSASGSVEVQQDMLSISMNTVRDGADANAVQTQLKTALDAALTIAKAAALPGQLDVRTGNFSLYPRYGQNGKPIGWQGTTELILEGRDIARISTTAGKIQTLTMGNVSFGLSREQRTRVEGEAQTQAITRFKAKAADVAKDFGFTGYTLREVSVNANDQGFNPNPRVMAMQAKAMSSDAPVPVEAGRTTVLVTVSGSVQLK
jgi:predicted secreted protein